MSPSQTTGVAPGMRGRSAFRPAFRGYRRGRRVWLGVVAVLVMAAAGLSWLLVMGGTGETGETGETVRLNPTVVPAAPSPPTPPNPSAPSVGPTIDLSGWKLVQAFAGAKGDAATVSPAVVFPPWLVPQSDGSLRFFAPSYGVSTPNPDHPAPSWTA